MFTMNFFENLEMKADRSALVKICADGFVRFSNSENFIFINAFKD